MIGPNPAGGRRRRTQVRGHPVHGPNPAGADVAGTQAPRALGLFAKKIVVKFVDNCIQEAINCSIISFGILIS